MRYKIINVFTHDHEVKKERIGRIVSLINLEIDHSAVFAYEDGNTDNGFVTSVVDSFEHSYDKDHGHQLLIKTANSIYVLKEIQ